MSVNAGPDIADTGLVFSFDAANLKSYNPQENLLTYSEQLSHANWSVIGTLTATANVTLAPDGTLTGNKLVLGNGLAFNSSALGQNPTKPGVSVPYTFSVYVKAAEFNQVRVLFRDISNNSNSSDCAIYASNGAVGYNASALGTFSNASMAVTSANNGWWRVALTATTGTETQLRAQVYTYDSVATTGNGTSGIYFWGAQLERNSVASPYTKTAATAIAKATTVLDVSGQGATGTIAQAPSFISSSGGALRFASYTGMYQYCSTTHTQPAYQSNTDFTWSVWVNPGVSSNAPIVGNRYNSNATYDFTKLDQNMVFEFAHPTITTLGPGPVTYGNWYHACIVKNQSTITYYLNNAVANTDAAVPTASGTAQKFWIGGDSDAGEFCNNAIIAKVDIYNRALTASEISANFNAHRGRFGI